MQCMFSRLTHRCASDMTKQQLSVCSKTVLDSIRYFMFITCTFYLVYVLFCMFSHLLGNLTLLFYLVFYHCLIQLDFMFDCKALCEWRL